MFDLFLEPFHPQGKLFDFDVQHAPQVVYAPGKILVVPQGRDPRHGGETPYPRPDALFSEDLYGADLPRGAHVGTAAEFGARPGHGHKAHFVAIFLVK
ncbi:MAG: hypothetical protein BWY88_01166 [Synergistetes bacterium ADurb.Bin520]|nr:MAG: hypothetical protein BWY88_01166 [Synergistetes bacterium ADurb.Bin520]